MPRWPRLAAEILVELLAVETDAPADLGDRGIISGQKSEVFRKIVAHLALLRPRTIDQLTSIRGSLNRALATILVSVTTAVAIPSTAVSVTVTPTAVSITPAAVPVAPSISIPISPAAPVAIPTTAALRAIAAIPG